MEKKSSGLVVEITEGPRKGKQGKVYHRDQERFKQRGKVPVVFPQEEKIILMHPKKVKPIGFFD